MRTGPFCTRVQATFVPPTFKDVIVDETSAEPFASALLQLCVRRVVVGREEAKAKVGHMTLGQHATALERGEKAGPAHL